MNNDHLLQVIKPQGFVATRFGFDSPLSTDTEQALSKACDGLVTAGPADVNAEAGIRYA
jgi:hypothetical protein